MKPKKKIKIETNKKILSFFYIAHRYDERATIGRESHRKYTKKNVVSMLEFEYLHNDKKNEDDLLVRLRKNFC